MKKKNSNQIGYMIIFHRNIMSGVHMPCGCLYIETREEAKKIWDDPPIDAEAMVFGWDGKRTFTVEDSFWSYLGTSPKRSPKNKR